MKTIEIKDLNKNQCYVGKYSNYTYVFRPSGKTADLMRKSDKYYGKSAVRLDEMEKCREATSDETEHFEACETAKRYVSFSAVPKYIIKTGNFNYIVATEKGKKITWSEEVKSILHILNDETPIVTTGTTTKKPKNLKALKKLVK